MSIREWWTTLVANIIRSWSMWTAYLYIAFGALFDYFPAFRSILGRHYNRIFVITGIVMIVLRFKTSKPIVPERESKNDRRKHYQ